MGVDEDLAAQLRAMQAQLAAIQERMGPARAPSPAPSTQRLVGDLHAEWLETLRGVARKNRTSQGRHIHRPFKHRGEKLVLALLTPEECTPPILVSWQQMLLGTELVHHKGQTLSPGAADQIRMGLQSCFKYYVRLGELADNPLRTVPRLPGRDRERQGYMTREEMERFAAAFPQVGQYIIRHMFWTGCRRGNIQKLRKHEIDWESSDLVLTVKGGRPARVAVPPPVLEEMRHLCAVSPSEWVYPSPKNPKRHVPDGTWQRWCERAQKATGMTLAGERAVPHHARHGAAVDMLAHGADLTEVQAQLTQRNIATTARYAKMRDRMRDRLRAKLAARLAK